ncbi:hypothetical protein WEI85_33035 [Actinomycetes bacterium KLBMP 9797]
MEQTGHISPVFVDSTGRRRRRLRRVAYLFGTVSLVYTGLVSASFSSGPGSPFGLPPLPDLLDRPDRAPSTAPRERPVAAPAGESPIGVWVEARNAGPRSTDRGGAPVPLRPAGPAGAVSTPGPLAAVGELGSAGGPPVPVAMPESTQAPQASASPRPEGDPAPAPAPEPEPASPQPTVPSDPSPEPAGDPAPVSAPAEPSDGVSGTPESASVDTSRAGRPSPRPGGRAAAQTS